MNRVYGRCAARVRGFTLIELLVVIAIIAILISILAPALAEAKCLAKNTVEMSAGRELQRAYNIYSSDFKDKLLIGFLHYSAGHQPEYMQPNDLGVPMEGWIIKRYPWRLMPWLDYDMRGMVVDKTYYKDFFSRQRNRVSGGGFGNSVHDDAGKFEDMFSLNPSFGLNSVFLGGDYEYGAFRTDQSNAGINTKKIPQAPSDIFHTDKMQVFVTARGPTRNASGGTREDIAPGYFRVFAPRSPSGTGNGGGPGNFSGRWYPGPWNPNRPPADYGFVDMRACGERAITTHIDGHVETVNWDTLRDGRRWANHARGPNHYFTNWIQD